MTVPPLEPLLVVSRRLTDFGVVHALGGSGLRFALGEGRDVGDWDLTTDGDPTLVHRALIGFEHHLLPGRPPWTTTAAWTLDVDGTPIDVLVGFGVRVGHESRQVRTVVTGWWHGVPLGDADAWSSAMLLVRP